MKYELADKYEQFEDFTKNIQEHFKEEKSNIHKARNEIKVLTYNDKKIVVKSFEVLSFFKRFIYTFLRASKAKRTFLYSKKLGFFTPKPIAYIEFFKNGLLEKSYCLNEKFNFDFTIREPLMDNNFQDKKEILKQFAIFTCKLHDEKIYHLDYSPGNILIKKEKDGYSFKIVDVNRMKFFAPNLKQRMKNFERLTQNDEDLKIIAKEYAKIINEDELTCKKLAIYYSKKHTLFFTFKRKIRGKKI